MNLRLQRLVDHCHQLAKKLQHFFTLPYIAHNSDAASHNDCQCNKWRKAKQLSKCTQFCKSNHSLVVWRQSPVSMVPNLCISILAKTATILPEPQHQRCYSHSERERLHRSLPPQMTMPRYEYNVHGPATQSQTHGPTAGCGTPDIAGS